MAADYSIVAGDTLPVFQDNLTYSSGSQVDLTGCTVNFVMRALTANTPTTNAAATVVLPATAGQVQYVPTTTDTATAGQYMGNWVVTGLPGTTGPMTFPTVGYLEIIIEENLTTPGGARLVGLGELKDHLRIPPTDRTHDARLVALLDASAPVIEGITGPILQHIYQNETYDGGGYFLSLRHRPVLSVESVVEYRGSIPYNLTQIATPDQGTIYSYMFEPPGRLVRRTVGGGATQFPSGPDAVFVTYIAGYGKVPANVREATLELIRINYQQSEQGTHPIFGGSQDIGEEMTGPALGFYVPWRVRELLAPSKRHPSVA